MREGKGVSFLHEAMRDGEWAGSRCFIIGGGPSLKDFDFELLRGEKCIAINRAVESVPWAEIMFSIDVRLFNWYRKNRRLMPQKALSAFDSFQGKKVWAIDPFPAYADPLGWQGIFVIKFIGKHGFSRHLSNGIYCGGNSGYGALNLAAMLGANPICLLGFDMQNEPGGQANFHSGYPASSSDPVVRHWRENFEMIAPEYVHAGIDVINLNLNSRLRCFQFGVFEKGAINEAN
jgi:hypothetical protein